MLTIPGLQPICIKKASRIPFPNSNQRSFAYDAANRHSQTTVMKDGEASKITYLHNGAGQRVFKSEPQVAQTIPNATTLGTPFVTWLKTDFQWLFAAAQTNATLGQSYVYADGQLPGYAP